MAKQLTRWVALLRGINVGGRNLISMSDLKVCFESLGFDDVQTYIQSGNVLFSTRRLSRPRMLGDLKKALSRRFGYQARVALFSCHDFRSELDRAHDSWGVDPLARHNAMFLLDAVTVDDIRDELPPASGSERVSLGHRAIFWSAEMKSLHQTAMMKLAALPVYQQMTVRNANTTRRLLGKLGDV